MVFKQAGKIKYTEAPVLLQSFEQDCNVLICDNMESSETHNGQGMYIISQYSHFPTVLSRFHSKQMMKSDKKKLNANILKLS